MDLGAWLRGLSLERYEAAFRENEIDETVLASLTHETLKELGVAELGGQTIPMLALYFGSVSFCSKA
jgi:SAM domain (Sterile alpha motif)